MTFVKSLLLSAVASTLCFGAVAKAQVVVPTVTSPEAKNEALPILYDVPPFALIDQNAKPVTLDTFKGKVWVVDFLYTKCSDECPLMTSKMKRIQDALKGSDHIFFVSVTTDPKNDKPKKLKAYAKTHKVNENNWLFLTGPKKAIVDLSVNGFKLTASETSVAHTGKFALVDSVGRIRGYYESTDPKAMTKLTADIKGLTSEPAEAGKN